jgi:hypothetical protein
MPKSIQIVKQSTVELPGISSYKLIVQTRNAQEMTSKIFIKQRVRNFAKNTTDDVFVGVCTPVQLEDFDEDAPAEGSSYFRSDYIELIGRTPEFLREVFDTLVYETKKLVVDLSDLDSLAEAQVYTISANAPVTELQPAPSINNIISSKVEENYRLTINFTPVSGVAGSPVFNYDYSLDNGVSWNTVLPLIVTSPILLENLQKSSTYGVVLRAVNSKGIASPLSATVYASTQS